MFRKMIEVNKEVESGGALLLIRIGAVPDFAQPMDEDHACQTAVGLAFVQLPSGLPAQLRLTDPIPCEQRSLQSPQLAD